MATHQDCWKGKEHEAIEWLKNLKIGDKLLHPPPKQDLNCTKPDGEGFQEVTIESIHRTDPNGAHVIVRFPDRNPMWNKRLPIKYAFAGLSTDFNPCDFVIVIEVRLALTSHFEPISNTFPFTVRPVDSLHLKSEYADDTKDVTENGDQSSQSSLSSDVSLGGDPNTTVPFGNLQNTRMQNNPNSVKFTFNKKKKKRRLNPGNSTNTLLVDSPRPSPIGERTPSLSERTVFNKLHETRKACTSDPKMIKTYADTNGSRNRRNRALKENGTKIPGHIRKQQQMTQHAKKQREGSPNNSNSNYNANSNLNPRTHSHSHSNGHSTGHSNGNSNQNQSYTLKSERDDDTDDTLLSNGCDPHSNIDFNSNDSEEDRGPMTRSRQRQQNERKVIQSGRLPDWLRQGISCRGPVGLSNMGNTCFMVCS